MYQLSVLKHDKNKEEEGEKMTDNWKYSRRAVNILECSHRKFTVASVEEQLLSFV